MSSIQQSPVECVYEGRAQLGEGPSWLPHEKKVLWVDIEKSLVHLFDPQTRANQTFDVGCHVGCAVPSRRGDVLIATAKGFGQLNRSSGQVTWITNPESHLPGNRFNDGKADPAGRFWAGSLPYAEDSPAGGLYVLDERRVSRKALNDVTISNGLAWSGDHRTMYYIDTPTMRVDAFDFDPATSSISNRRTVIRVPEGVGYPDGMAIDDEGMLWVGMWDGWAVLRWDPRTGRQIDKVELPVARVTACCFGGENRDELYLTSATTRLDAATLAKQPLAGGLFRVKLGVKGPPPFEYIG
ncbi:MAG: SMP-30/gluconolactonase/LRE family protein [Verrucomicrobia bacterium]|nr:SMP-30/gluconolactonase/LRE family protein [Verrucomicrobiota bacterium]MBI3871160.1 SMP-30/gluconolactonase/LRE family protein [Verrucomicrobiota bacterium]